jgi:predicted Zn-dependent protease
MNHSNAIAEFQRGVDLLRNRMPEDALAYIQRAYEMECNNPYFISYFGLVMGLARKRWPEAQKMCEQAVHLRRNQPQLYLNLAEVYRRTGRREQARATLATGLQLTGNSPALRSALGKLTDRRRPAIPFLRRGHPLNQRLGKLRSQMAEFFRA